MTSELAIYGSLLTEIKGFSERNIKRMLTFFREYPSLGIAPPPVAQLSSKGNLMEKVPQAVAQTLETNDFSIVQAPVAQNPWEHNIILMEKVKDLPTRLWYMKQTIEQGWSRDAMAAMTNRSTPAR